jgi:hypothetical protein
VQSFIKYSTTDDDDDDDDMVIKQTVISTSNSSKITFEAKLILTADIYPTG